MLQQLKIRASFAVLVVIIVIGAVTVLPPRTETAEARLLVDDEGVFSFSASFVRVQKQELNFRYLVNGKPQTFIGMGYNPIYRDLSDAERADKYDHDFRMLCEAGVNHLIGWDADKGYEQDKFDEITLDAASRHGIGVVMPFYLPFDGDYEDEAFRQSLLDQAATKIARFKKHEALRMWGPGNEVFADMAVAGVENGEAFAQFYVQLADLFRRLDPRHPVIYRDAEDTFFPVLDAALQDGPDRPWLLYGANVYSARLDEMLGEWRAREVMRPLVITEFGAEPNWRGDRAEGYVAMWDTIRAYPDYVLGGTPYAWTMDGPEPTDVLWGLTDNSGEPVDDTFYRLATRWHEEPLRNQCN